MISKYLKELIASNNRIIIPDLGAFMIQDTPNGKQITFNDFLKFNDGLLVNQIIRTDKVSKSEASEKIKEFAKEVDKSFSSGKPYLIEGVGSLVKDSHNNIKFESISKGVKEEKVVATDEKPTIVLDEKNIVTNVLLNHEIPEVKTIKEEVKPKITPKPAPKVEPPKAEQSKAEQFRTAGTTAASTKTPPVAPPIKPPVKKQVSNKTQGGDDSSKNIIIIIAIALIIIGGGTWAFFHFDVISMFGKNDIQAPTVDVIEPVILADSVAIDTVIKQPVVEQPEVVEETVVDNRTKYYIVGGSFKVVSNAENFSQKLIDEGFESEIILQDNGFHCVTYKIFYSWNEVVNEWQQMKNTHPETWILVK